MLSIPQAKLPLLKGSRRNPRLDRARKNLLAQVRRSKEPDLPLNQKHCPKNNAIFSNEVMQKAFEN